MYRVFEYQINTLQGNQNFIDAKINFWKAMIAYSMKNMKKRQYTI